MRRYLPLLLGLFAVIGLLSIPFVLPNPQQQPSAQLVYEQPDLSGFDRAEGPVPFDFPADHGPHPDYQTEWWYYTGNLATEDGRRFGYQLTFFRRALVPPDQRTDRLSDWGADQIYMAHFALSDIGADDFYSFERFSRSAADLAGAQSLPYRVWLDHWTAEEIAPDTYRLFAEQDGVVLDLVLSSAKPPILQGIDGYSQKGPDPGNASYYYSLTRLVSDGTVTVNGDRYPITGLSWMDHEYSTSALSAGQVGWDWFSLQLDDGSDIMVYQIRRDDGTVDPFSKGSFADADANTTLLRFGADYTITVLDTWRSPRTNAEYPARWQITIPSQGIDLIVEPLMANQELSVSFNYWEGAVRITGTVNGQPVSGYGYVEMTGYAASMEGQF